MLKENANPDIVIISRMLRFVINDIQQLSVLTRKLKYDVNNYQDKWKMLYKIETSIN